MSPAFGPILALVVMILLINFVFLYMRSKRNWRRRSARRAMTEKEARKIRTAELNRKFEEEFEEAEEYLERRRKTWALYEEVRKRAAAAEDVSGSGDASD